MCVYIYTYIYISYTVYHETYVARNLCGSAANACFAIKHLRLADDHATMVIIKLIIYQ